jgi:hypothetical protein
MAEFRFSSHELDYVKEEEDFSSVATGDRCTLHRWQPQSEQLGGHDTTVEKRKRF